MPKTSRTTAPTVADHGPVVDRSRPRGLQRQLRVLRHRHRRCPAAQEPARRPVCVPALGLRVQGERLVHLRRPAEETYEAGDAYYVPPGHTPAHSADSEILMFSPSEELAVTAAVMLRNMQAMMAAPGA